ncbi:hypothetical protein [Paenibacillus lautus]|uniref:hypothetical protein n=1 Tax=Paenibacillus lautus TaxID=1401 RepID=UPI002DB5A84E|nr:hypothetical protein [Paenibacillus lautus]MEC0260211.1 hypothetical protein [Paenibacillus lautus]
MEKKLRGQGETELKEILEPDQIKKGWAAIAKEVQEGYIRSKSTRQQVAKMGKSVEISVNTPYSEQKTMKDKKAKEELDIEEQLLNEALEAEQNSKRMGS